MVPGVHAEGEEEDPARARGHHPGSEDQDVQFSGVQGIESRLQEVVKQPRLPDSRLAFFCHLLYKKRGSGSNENSRMRQRERG